MMTGVKPQTFSGPEVNRDTEHFTSWRGTVMQLLVALDQKQGNTPGSWTLEVELSLHSCILPLSLLGHYSNPAGPSGGRITRFSCQVFPHFFCPCLQHRRHLDCKGESFWMQRRGQKRRSRKRKQDCVLPPPQGCVSLLPMFSRHVSLGRTEHCRISPCSESSTPGFATPTPALGSHSASREGDDTD